MNPYRCETCSYHPLHGKILKCPYDGAGIDEQIYYTLKEEMRLPRAAEFFTSIVGCASHSDFQSERDTVLELLRLKYVEFLNHPCPELADKYDHCCDAEWCGLCTLDEVLAELRRAGEP